MIARALSMTMSPRRLSRCNESTNHGQSSGHPGRGAPLARRLSPHLGQAARRQPARSGRSPTPGDALAPRDALA
jgi:hypothetical protein